MALRLNKQRFREMSQASFEDTMEAAIRLHKESYASGEPARMMEAFFQARGHAAPGRDATNAGGAPCAKARGIAVLHSRLIAMQ